MFTEKEIDAALEASRDFKPFAHYDSERDSFEFFASNESFYAQHLDELVTLYYGQETDNVVGLRLKKVKKFFRDFIKNAPGFKTEVQDHRIKVEHLFTAKIWSSSEKDGRLVTYRQMRDVAKENAIEAEIDDLAELAV